MIHSISQYVKNLNLTVPNSPQIYLQQNDSKPNIDISIDIDAKKLTPIEKDGESPANQLFEVILKISANANYKSEQEGDKTINNLFTLDVSYAGLFQIMQDDEAILEQMLLIYCPNLLFPFLRRIISTAVSDANLSPLMLEPIDFNDLYQRRIASTKQNKDKEQKIN